MAVMDIHVDEDVPARLMDRGARLAAGVREVAAAAGVGEHVVVRGRDCNLVFATLDGEHQPSQAYRTLFLRQLILGGVLGPSFVVSTALTDADIAHTIEAVDRACAVYRKALEAGDPSPWLGGRPVRPVFGPAR
jgi:glutamate-1-semialdehyde 2,1-aminomutase